jgi:hypothetical protein
MKFWVQAIFIGQKKLRNVWTSCVQTGERYYWCPIQSTKYYGFVTGACGLRKDES